MPTDGVAGSGRLPRGGGSGPEPAIPLLLLANLLSQPLDAQLRVL